jgi:hypothetical protein
VKNLQEATERICELKGNAMALDVLCSALIQQLTPSARTRVRRLFEHDAEIARTLMLHASISEVSIATFERDVARITALVDSLDRFQPPQSAAWSKPCCWSRRAWPPSWAASR